MKKAQIQMGESIAVVVIVIVLIVFGIVIYSRLSQSGIEEKQRIYEELDAIELATIILGLPETHCTFLHSTDINCLDRLKLKHFAGQLDESPAVRLFYADLFGESDVSVAIITPGEETEVITLYQGTTGEDANPFFVPVNIYDPLEQRYAFGYLNITVS